MHLQEGVGRAGFRLLVFMFFLIGVGGLAVAWAASTVEVSTVFLNVGLVTAGAGMLLLLVAALAGSISGLVDILPSFEAAKGEPTSRPSDEPAGEPGGTEPSGPVRSIDYEFPDAEPAAPAVPEKLVLPKAFQDQRPPASEGPMEPVAASPGPAAPARAPTRGAGAPVRGPAARDPARWPKDDGRAPEWTPPRPKVDAAGPEARKQMRERYTQNTPMLREVMQGRPEAPAASQPSASTARDAPERLPPAAGDGWDDDVPRIRAQRAPDDVDNDWLEDGQTIGRCGGCQTRVLAPTSRPVIIVCPACEREKLLE